MRTVALALLAALGLAAAAAPATASPALRNPAPHPASNIEQVAGGCGWGFHRYHGYCVRNHYYRPYAYYHRYYYRPYGYAPYPYYGGGYEPWNRPSPTDRVANQLNAREAARGWWGY